MVQDLSELMPAFRVIWIQLDSSSVMLKGRSGVAKRGESA